MRAVFSVWGRLDQGLVEIRGKKDILGFMRMLSGQAMVVKQNSSFVIRVIQNCFKISKFVSSFVKDVLTVFVTLMT